MSLKLNAGLSRKIGQPDYGSLGASCHLEVELDQSLLFDDLEALQERIESVFFACRLAVADELARQQPAAAPSADEQSRGLAPEQHGINGHHASQKQLDYARRLSGQIWQLGTRRLEALTQNMFSKPLADLSSPEASGLINMLKQIKAGKIDLATVTNSDAA